MNAASTARHRHHDQAGLSAGAEVLAFGFLVFVVGTIVALNGWAVLDADLAANAAAREATRAVVEGRGDAARVMVRARAVARATLDGHGKDAARAEVVLLTTPFRDGRPARCERVTIEVRLPVDPIAVPFVGAFRDPVVAVGQHTELVDPFRSGLSEVALCG